VVDGPLHAARGMEGMDAAGQEGHLQPASLRYTAS
jgi:hypothetical protein